MTDPLAPVPPSGSATDTCPRCQRPMDPSRAQYDDNGALVCALCIGEAASARASRTMTAPVQKSRKDILPGAVGAFMVAMLSFCVEHRIFFFLFPAVAFFYGGVTLHQLRSQPELRTAIGWQLWPSILFAVLACATAVLSILVGIAVRTG